MKLTANEEQIQSAVNKVPNEKTNGTQMNAPAGPQAGALRAAQLSEQLGLAEPRKLRAIDKSTSAFKLTYFDPPKGLERYILALFEVEFSSERVEDRHPGALGQLLMPMRGKGSAQFRDRVDRVEHHATLFNAFDVATPFVLEGSFWCIGASFSPHGWAALTQASVKDHGNRFMPASELLGGDVDRLTSDIAERRLSGVQSSEQACLEIADWIRERLTPIPLRHEEVIDKTLAWLGSSLNPPVEELFAESGYSRRQTERLILQYFGFAPSGLARKFRAIRAANLLAHDGLNDEGEAEIASAFVDQSHMIREIRRFCGYTPSRLGGPIDPMFMQLTNMQNLDRFRPYRAIGSDHEADGPPL